MIVRIEDLVIRTLLAEGLAIAFNLTSFALVAIYPSVQHGSKGKQEGSDHALRTYF